MRPAIRLAALSEFPTVFVFTHDSIGLGEDGPTHQPIEHIMSLRLIPHLDVIRPADANETAGAWRAAIRNRERPTVLLFTRQNVPVLAGDVRAIWDGVERGAYVLSEAEGGDPAVILIGTGSEVHLALDAQKLLAEKGVRARVVSMPSWERFERQPQEYRDSVLPPEITARVAVEAGVTLGWEKWVSRRVRWSASILRRVGSVPGDLRAVWPDACCHCRARAGAGRARLTSHTRRITRRGIGWSAPFCGARRAFPYHLAWKKLSFPPDERSQPCRRKAQCASYASR